jgi:hypothetical protein
MGFEFKMSYVGMSTIEKRERAKRGQKEVIFLDVSIVTM